MLVRYALYKALKLSLECSRKVHEKVLDLIAGHDWEWIPGGGHFSKNVWMCTQCGVKQARKPGRGSVGTYPCLAKIGGFQKND